MFCDGCYHPRCALATLRTTKTGPLNAPHHIEADGSARADDRVRLWKTLPDPDGQMVLAVTCRSFGRPPDASSGTCGRIATAGALIRRAIALRPYRPPDCAQRRVRPPHPAHEMSVGRAQDLINTPGWHDRIITPSTWRSTEGTAVRSRTLQSTAPRQSIGIGPRRPAVPCRWSARPVRPAADRWLAAEDRRAVAAACRGRWPRAGPPGPR